MLGVGLSACVLIRQLGVSVFESVFSEYPRGIASHCLGWGLGGGGGSEGGG